MFVMPPRHSHTGQLANKPEHAFSPLSLSPLPFTMANPQQRDMFDGMLLNIAQQTGGIQDVSRAGSGSPGTHVHCRH